MMVIMVVPIAVFVSRQSVNQGSALVPFYVLVRLWSACPNVLSAQNMHLSLAGGFVWNCGVVM